MMPDLFISFDIYFHISELKYKWNWHRFILNSEVSFNIYPHE